MSGWWRALLRFLASARLIRSLGWGADLVNLALVLGLGRLAQVGKLGDYAEDHALVFAVGAAAVLLLYAGVRLQHAYDNEAGAALEVFKSKLGELITEANAFHQNDDSYRLQHFLKEWTPRAEAFIRNSVGAAEAAVFVDNSGLDLNWSYNDTDVGHERQRRIIRLRSLLERAPSLVYAESFRKQSVLDIRALRIHTDA